jgi:hypothetical protein
VDPLEQLRAAILQLPEAGRRAMVEELLMELYPPPPTATG